MRCKWCNLNNPLYVSYHDNEWGILRTDDRCLFEMLILESFQAGLSWECISNNRDAFRVAYENFSLDKVWSYDDEKISELIGNNDIIRNKLKIRASVNNARIFRNIVLDFGSFYNYLCSFTNGKVFYEIGETKSLLSDSISSDLVKRGMKFVGSTIIYSYLQAIGVIYSHDRSCYLYRSSNDN